MKGKAAPREGTWKSILAHGRSRRGAEVVEAALVMPLLVMLVFGMVDFGLLIYNKAVITNAAREGARAGIVYLPSPDVDHLPASDIRLVVTSYCREHLIAFGSHVLSASDVTVTNAAGAPGTELRVTVRYPHEFAAVSHLVPGLDDVVQLASTSVMRIE